MLDCLLANNRASRYKRMDKNTNEPKRTSFEAAGLSVAQVIVQPDSPMARRRDA
jgi:hypothetical protein